ncbi:unnamed protein product, partial [Iphiclides podalirius]
MEPDLCRVILDIVLAVPYSLLYFIDPDEAWFDFYTISPIMATIRVYRIIEYFYDRSTQAGSNQWTTFLVQYLILFVLSVHTWTCIWYLYAYRNYDIHKNRSSWATEAVYLPTETTFDWYFICAYWSVMFLTTNALGDLYPVTTPERISAIGAILLGFLLTTIVFVGSLTSQFITITTRRAKYVRQLKKIQNHLQLIKMDEFTTNRIIRYYEDLWYEKSGVFKPKLMKLLPFPLQMEICYDLNAVPLYSSLIFRKLPEAFLRRLSVTMGHRFYLPGDIIYNHNQNKTVMICITNGVLELLSDEDDESPMISFSKGTCFGEISLILNIPDLMDQIRKEMHNRIIRSRNRKENQTGDDQLLLNIYVSKDRKKSSIKCLKDKLRYRQGKTDVDGVELTDDSWLDTTVVPTELRRKVLHQARFKALTSIKFFQVKNKAYIQTLSAMARDIILPPGEIVYYGGTISRELYIVERGYCLVTSKALREAKKERVVGPGNHLGLLVMLYGVPAVNTVVTLTHCKLISISHFAYTSALNLFPEMREHEGLLKPDELKMIEEQARLHNTDAYLQNYVFFKKTAKTKITNFFQELLDSSWLDEAKTFKVKNLTPSKAYLLAYYWSAASFSGAGFGDIIAQDTAHMILSICINVHGVLFFGAFAKQLQEKYFQKGYMVMKANEVISSMYIIYRGKVDVISDSNEVEACMGPGGIFGNIRGALKYQTLSNVVASRNIDLLSIQGTDFYAILRSYPSVLKKVQASFSTTTKDYVLPTTVSERTSLESPEKSIAGSHGSRSFMSMSNTEYVPARLLLFTPHRWFRSSVVPDSKFVTFMGTFPKYT